VSQRQQVATPGIYYYFDDILLHLALTMTALPPNRFITINKEPIYFDEDWDTGIGGGLWSTGLAMAKYFELHQAHLERNLDLLFQSSPLNVLELGSGNGFIAVCLLALLKSRISKLVVTDLADHIPLIRHTLTANQHLRQDNVIVVDHQWGSFSPTEHKEDDLEALIRGGKYSFDLIVGSDVAYHRSLFDILITSLVRFSHSDTVILLGVTMKDTTPDFFSKLRENGFRYQRVADHLLPVEFRGSTFGLFVLRR
jgi:predicted nicotinamide N-methyase